MVFAVPQRILLLCLLHFCTCAAAETVDPKTLMSIVKNFEKQLGNMGQYAVAFRVEKHRCLKGSDYPSKELLTKVKEKLQLNEVYVSDDLIAAKRNGNEHSEFRLKNHLKNILKDEDELSGGLGACALSLPRDLLLADPLNRGQDSTHGHYWIQSAGDETSPTAYYPEEQRETLCELRSIRMHERNQVSGTSLENATPPPAELAECASSELQISRAEQHEE
ncbi:hypothetical protein G5714_015395 [Onychostoma macrolepis]|uniref:Uncharacterized protein n=1 Tax=Onychostoma macrolepis TaxID=369639 RepID=A0A7J6CAR6_9TELE|nr:hypothetical protein G5714_015395 [Onychostoma macrolepis]